MRELPGRDYGCLPPYHFDIALAHARARRRLPFKSVIVHQDFESGISKKDRVRITSARCSAKNHQTPLTPVFSQCSQRLRGESWASFFNIHNLAKFLNR
jgi:hypothetical protein